MVNSGDPPVCLQWSLGSHKQFRVEIVKSKMLKMLVTSFFLKRKPRILDLTENVISLFTLPIHAQME